jgi:hypothetical protein
MLSSRRRLATFTAKKKSTVWYMNHTQDHYVKESLRVFHACKLRAPLQKQSSIQTDPVAAET